ncbi:MAG TPA: hypothetical protein VF756_05285 [Thermoanaerobaculia bacterium]
MTRVSRTRMLATIFVLAVLAAIPTLTLANHSWGSYHWARTSNPFTLKVGDNVTSAWDAYLNEAIADWSASTVLNLTKVTGGTTGRQCKPTAGRIEACNAAYGFNGWLGIAQIWASGNHITQATTKLNDSYYNTATYNTPAWRRLVMCQEIAHDFGLDHQDEVFDNANLGSCMDYTNSPAGNEHPNAHDFEQLLTIYGHLDSTTTIGAALPASAPPAMNQIDFSGPKQWGRVIGGARSPMGNLVSTHELDFGNGNKVITHVFWALEGHGR